jgi:hypothetical protein
MSEGSTGQTTNATASGLDTSTSTMNFKEAKERWPDASKYQLGTVVQVWNMIPSEAGRGEFLSRHPDKNDQVESLMKVINSVDVDFPGNFGRR